MTIDDATSDIQVRLLVCCRFLFLCSFDIIQSEDVDSNRNNIVNTYANEDTRNSYDRSIAHRKRKEWKSEWEREKGVHVASWLTSTTTSHTRQQHIEEWQNENVTNTWMSGVKTSVSSAHHTLILAFVSIVLIIALNARSCCSTQLTQIVHCPLWLLLFCCLPVRRLGGNIACSLDLSCQLY
jgi:hypothetical protein